MIEDADLPALNRSLLIIEMKQPFVDWLNSIRDKEELKKQVVYTLDDVNDELATYLIPEIFDADDFEAFMERFWIMLFELQLSGWMLDEKLWPKQRTRKLFDQWFGLECSTLVHDLWGKEPLGYQE